MATIGAGLMVVGLALAFYLFGEDKTASGLGSSGSYGVVPASVNFAAPALELPTTTGELEALADYRGRVVLVNNWATWCPPCKAEMPTLQAYYEAHSREGLTVIGIEAGDTARSVKEFKDAMGLTFPVWVDTEAAAVGAFRNGALPNSYVIDRAGMVRLAWVGEISRAALEQYVTPMLAEN
jgi:peroxiredoxin